MSLDASGASAGGTLRGRGAAGTRPAGFSLAQDELIGLRARVAASGDAGLLGLEGRVLDETQRTFVLDTPKGPRTVPKQGQRFQFTLPDGSSETLEGSALAHRPEERIKKAARPAGRRRTPSTR